MKRNTETALISVDQHLFWSSLCQPTQISLDADRQTDRQTDQPTDITAYRVAFQYMDGTKNGGLI